MSDTAFDPHALSAATQIIDLFGGVRPLAKKLDMAASTVQGWKLRNHIPVHYHDKLRDLASTDEKDNLNHLLQATLDEQAASAAAAQAAPASTASSPTSSAHPSTANSNRYAHTTSSFKPTPKSAPRDPNAAYFAMPQAQVRYWVMTALASIGILALLVVVLIFLFFGGDIINYIKPSASSESSATAPSAASQALTATPKITPPFENAANHGASAASTAEDQAHDLVRHSRDVIDSTLDDVRKIKHVTPASQTHLVAQIHEIELMITSLRDRLDQLDKQIQDKGLDTQALQAQMSEISRRDVAAAALLLGVAQLSSILDRQSRFHDDLEFLKTIVSYDPQLVQSIDKLAPFAEKGLMTKTQMLETLNLLKDQAIAAGKDNPNASWTERLKTAASQVIHIRKNETAHEQVIATMHVNGKTVAVPETPYEQILLAQDLLRSDHFKEAAHILKDYHGPHTDVVLDIAYNMQGRDAAASVMNVLMQKSQGFLDHAHLKSILSSEQSLSGTLY